MPSVELLMLLAWATEKLKHLPDRTETEREKRKTYLEFIDRMNEMIEEEEAYFNASSGNR